MTGLLIIALSGLPIFAFVREKLSTDAAYYVPLVIILTANAFCALFLLVGIPWYWMRFDDSPRFVKLLWLGSFFALGWYSMSIYYFFVYRCQKQRHGAAVHMARSRPQ